MRSLSRWRYLLSLSLTLWVAGCAGTVRSYFDANGLRYPKHVQRRPTTVQVSDGLAADRYRYRAKCRAAEEHRGFLLEALALMHDGTLRELVEKHCPRSVAHAFMSPFVIVPTVISERQLAIRMECYYDGSPVAGVSIEEVRAATRSEVTEIAIDGWPSNEIGPDAVGLWNIAHFQVDEGRLIFDGFVFRHVEVDFRNSQLGMLVLPTPGHVPTVDAFWQCGGHDGRRLNWGGR